MKEQLVEIKREKGIAILQMTRPEKRNALSPEMIAALDSSFRELSNDNEVKIILLRGNDQAFSAGADLAYLQKMQSFSDEENLKDSQRLRELLEFIYMQPKLVIAEVKGPAIAGGCGLATVCDLIVATPETPFGYSEVRIGFIPAIVMIFLIRKVGEGHAKRLLLTGERITGSEAKDMGLVNYLFSTDEIEERTLNLAQKIHHQCSGDALGATKKLIGRIQDLPLHEALDRASKANMEARKSADCNKGIRAFLNKDKISWD